jgi:hypothetical protein
MTPQVCRRLGAAGISVQHCACPVLKFEVQLLGVFCGTVAHDLMLPVLHNLNHCMTHAAIQPTAGTPYDLHAPSDT